MSEISVALNKIYNVSLSNVLSHIFGLISYKKRKIDGKVICFANDTGLLFNNNSINKFYVQAFAGLTLVKKLLDKSSLELNLDKSCYLYFSITKFDIIYISWYRMVLYNNAIARLNNFGGCVLKKCNFVKY